MGKKAGNGMGLVLAGVAALVGYSVLRQGQATANTLTTARMTGFELKSLSGGSLVGVAQVEFANASVNRATQLQALGMNVVYNATVIGTVHLTTPQTLPANVDTVVPLPVSIKLVSLMTQLALTGKVPALASFTSIPKLVAWLQDKIAPEALRMQGTAKVDGLIVNFDYVLNLADYLPAAPRPAPVEQLPGRQPVVRQQGTRPVPTTVVPTTVPRHQGPNTVVKTGKKAGNLLRKAAPLVQQATTLIHQATDKRKARPAALLSDLAVLREGAAARDRAAQRGARKTGGKRPPRPGNGRVLDTPTAPIPYS